MSYRLPCRCKQCNHEYQQISGIDVDPASQRELNCYYSCPICGSAEAVPTGLTWRWTVDD